MRSGHGTERKQVRLLLGLILLALVAVRPGLPPAGEAAQVLGTRITGSGSSNPAAQKEKDKPKQSFTISGDVGGLYPGAEEQLLLTVTNPNRFEIIVESLTVEATGVDTDHSTCPTSDVETTDFSGSLLVPKNGAVVQAVPIRMIADAHDACQGAIFSLLYGGRAVKK